MNNFYKKEAIKDFEISNTYIGLSQIKLSNFKSISDENPQKIDLYPLTVICGENSSGKSTLLNSILLVTQILRSRGQTEEIVELNGPLIQLTKYDQIINKNSSTDKVSLGFSFLTLKERDVDYGKIKNPMYVNVDIDLESSEDEATSHYPQLKDYRIFLNEISKRGGSLEEVNDTNSEAHSLVSYSQEIKFEKKEVLKKINKQIETGIISYNNPRNNSIKSINNPWVCRFKQKHFYINEDFRSQFENDIYDLNEQEGSQHFGIKFDGGLPRIIQNRKDFFEEYPSLISKSIESYFDKDIYVEDNLLAFQDWPERYDTDKPEVQIDEITSEDQIREQLINSFSSILDISDFQDLLSSDDINLENSNKAIHLKLNDAPFITSDYKSIYENKFELAKDLMELVNDESLIDEIFKYDLELIGYAITLEEPQDKLDFFQSAINQQFWIRLQDVIRKKIDILVSKFENKENVMIDLDATQIVVDSDYNDIYSINSSITLNQAHNFIKYIGPLRNLNNSEPRIYKYDINIPLGLSGEYFFNFYHDAVEDNPNLKNEFNDYLSYFEIASEFDTKYDPDTNSINGLIKPIGLESSIGMKSLGVGFSQLAPLILLCISSQPGSTILIEQPELHLHPKVQQKFGDFLIKVMEEKGIQIIVETHSDHMLNRLRRRIAQAKLENLDEKLFEKCGIYFAERTEGVTDFREARLTRSATYDMTDFPKGFFDQGAEDAFYILKASLEE